MAGREVTAGSRRVALWTLIALATFTIGTISLRAAGKLPSLHAYYIPSEAMMPTLLKNDHILAVAGPGAVPRRGDVVLFLTGKGDTYIKRVAGLPGDRIAFVGGIVVLNGQAVPQRPLGTEELADGQPRHSATRMEERFPGERQPHQIYDSGASQYDDVPEQRVAAGHLFVLGDNRDNSADSRVPTELYGVSQVAIADVVGRAPVYTWGKGRKFGDPVR